MRSGIRRGISALCAVFLLLSVMTAAFADVNNSMKGQGGGYVDNRSGLEVILDTGRSSEITMPSPKDYYSVVTPMYVDAPKDHSVNVYKATDHTKAKTAAYDGDKVLAVAEYKDLTCVVFRDRENVQHPGWVETAHLTTVFPGVTQTIGKPGGRTGTNVGDPAVSWSKSNFVGTKQKYTVLDEPVYNCVQFKLNYQITDRTEGGINDVLGPRKVYVNEGDGWVQVGTFDYSTYGGMLVTINLSEPMDILAVATEAICAKPDGFLFRQSVNDAMAG